jgi:hypothetical protein
MRDMSGTHIGNLQGSYKFMSFTTGKKLDANDRGCDETNKEIGNERPCPEWTYIQK